MKLDRRTLLSLLGASPAVLSGSALASDNQKAQGGAVDPTPFQFEGLNPHLLPLAQRAVD
jgi:hypothetical protein